MGLWDPSALTNFGVRTYVFISPYSSRLVFALHTLPMAPLPPAAMTSIRPRRVFAFFTILIGFLLIFGVPWSLPPSLRDAGISALSRANIAHLVKSTSDPTVPPPKIDEIYGLLHLVTADTDEEYSLDSVTDLDPMQPINMTVYAAGDKKINWSTTVKRLDKNYPIVVFSKVRHQDRLGSH